MANLRNLRGTFDLDRIIAASELRHIEYHDTLASTNTTARELLSPLLDHAPSLVLTSEQLAGRGRKGNVWWSSGGALTFSWIVDAAHLSVTAERRPLISLAAGLAVHDALTGLVPTCPFLLKWPNDVLVGPQKICGILVEQHSVDDRQGVIIGIGVNVNNSLRDAPSDIAQRAISLFDLEGRSFDLNELLISILQRLSFRIHQLTTQPRLALAEMNRFNVLTGRIVTLQTGESSITGVCVGVDDEGQLVLQTERQLHRRASGVVVKWD
ncbi:MAG TPA: biotin--[acetyl-CoA-carboxylase] ligase [Planctomycetaceae bacterium]|nr:biotin--[acetyl-CoA-carboxylase] ligase [Planctomycetaceae bacterium]HQZ66331.1 biotin--[acetyl-CoA-carboxylase] ligase [Planctomycetaceae bacterium]HRA88981.1 biotin--[acetyl-CoA-carboxylase] ligase [Planctomycetaceae bacterium]